MRATARHSGGRVETVGGTYGVRVGAANRDRYFSRDWESIQVEIDGVTHQFPLTAGFWSMCPEFRGIAIKEWLLRLDLLPWPWGYPPRFELIPTGGQSFHLKLWEDLQLSLFD